MLHRVKSFQIRSIFWSLFSCIRTEYRDLLRKSPYSGIQFEYTKIRTRKNSVFGHFSRSAQCKKWRDLVIFRFIALFSLVDISMEKGINISKQYGFTHQLSHDEKMHVVTNKEQQDQVFRWVHECSEELIRRYILEIIISHVQKSLLKNTVPLYQQSTIFLIIHFCASTKFESCKIEQLFVRTLHDELQDKLAAIFTGAKEYSKYPLLIPYTSKQEIRGNFLSIYQFSMSLLNF